MTSRTKSVWGIHMVYVLLGSIGIDVEFGEEGLSDRSDD
jgi:hypothetical protein